MLATAGQLNQFDVRTGVLQQTQDKVWEKPF